MRSRFSVQSPHEAAAQMMRNGSHLVTHAGGGSRSEGPLGPRRASESAVQTQQWMPQPGYHHHTQHHQQHQHQAQQHQQQSRMMPAAMRTSSGGLVSPSASNGCVSIHSDIYVSHVSGTLRFVLRSTCIPHTTPANAKRHLACIDTFAFAAHRVAYVLVAALKRRQMRQPARQTSLRCACFRTLHMNPFQRHSEATAASIGGITQSALQEANALLDLRVNSIPSTGGGGDALTAGSCFSAPLAPSVGSGGQGLDPIPSVGAAAAAAAAAALHHMPLRLLSGHNSGNTFSGVPHGYRVEAGGEAAALLAAAGTAAHADAASGAGGGLSTGAQTTSRGSTGGDMAPPPPRHAVDATAVAHAPAALPPVSEVTSQARNRIPSAQFIHFRSM